VKVKGKSGTTPLVDTGQLYNDFDWEITGKLPVLLIRVLTKCSYKRV
jgi:hypothetical protein